MIRVLAILPSFGSHSSGLLQPDAVRRQLKVPRRERPRRLLVPGWIHRQPDPGLHARM